MVTVPQRSIGLKFKPETLWLLISKESYIEKALENIAVFMDCKIHDTPNQAAKRMEDLVNMFPNLAAINLMAMGGAEMMRACSEKLKSLNFEGDLLAVTIPTTMNDEDIAQIGLQRSVAENVSQLVDLAIACGVRGFVCSPHEIVHVDALAIGRNPSYCPGIRYSDKTITSDDQKRVTTPYKAIIHGVTYPIIGSPIYKLETVEEMEAMVKRILGDIQNAKNDLAAA